MQSANSLDAVEDAYQKASKNGFVVFSVETLIQVLKEVLSFPVGSPLPAFDAFSWEIRGAVPKGFVILPQEPCDEMIKAVKEFHPQNTFCRESYREMLEVLSKEALLSYTALGLPAKYKLSPLIIGGSALSCWTKNYNSFSQKAYEAMVLKSGFQEKLDLTSCSFMPVFPEKVFLTKDLFIETFDWLKNSKIPFRVGYPDFIDKSNLCDSTTNFEINLDIKNHLEVLYSFLKLSFFKGLYNDKVLILPKEYFHTLEKTLEVKS